MNNENQNQTNNQDTVEQDHILVTAVSPEPATAPAPTEPETSIAALGTAVVSQPPITTDSSDPSEPSDSSDSSPTTDQPQSVPFDPAPATDNGPLATNQPQSTQPPLDPTLVPSRRRGPVSKVAKLPAEVRNLINEQLLLGTSYKSITELLEEMGYPGFSHMNICRWAQGGFKTWAFLQVDLTLQKARREAALKQAIDKGHRLDEAALNMTLTNVCDIVANLDVRKIQSQLQQNPGHFVALFNGLSRFVTRNNAFDRIKNSPGNTIKPVITCSEATGGLTVEQRDAAAARLGIF